MASWTLGNVGVIASHIFSQIVQPTLPSNPLDCVETSMPKFKVTLQKDILHLVEVMAILAGDTSCHIQGLRSVLYALVIMNRGKMSFMIIDNGDSHLVRDIEYRIFPCHDEGAFWIITYLDIH